MNQSQEQHASGMPLSRHQIIDPQHQGLWVASFEHPQSWQSNSQVIWNFQNTSAPVWIHAATFNPHGSEAFEFLSAEPFYWLEPNYGGAVMGQNQYGMTCMPPMPASDAMTRWVIPKYRSNCQNLRVTGVQPMPNLLQIIGDFALAQMPSESVGVRIQYEDRGHAFEEEFYGVKTQNQAGSGMSMQINWGFARLFCFRAARGHLEASRETFWRIAGSSQPNPQWQGLYQQIVQQLNSQHGAMIAGWQAKLQGEAQFQGQLTDYYQGQRDHQNADITGKIAADQRHQQASPSHLTAQEEWRNELGAETAYIDPNSATGNVIYRSSSDQVAFMNEQGEVISSPDINFDPNIGSTQNWKRLDQA